MQRHYAAIPIHFPMDIKNVRAIAQHGSQLYIGLEAGRLDAIPIIIDSSNNIRLGEPDCQRVKVEGYEIAELCSFGTQILIHITSENHNSGPLISVLTKGKIETIEESVDCFAADSGLRTKTLAITSDRHLRIKKYESGKWKAVFNRDVSEPILSVALSFPKVLTISANEMTLTDADTGKSNSLKTQGIMKPRVMSRDIRTYFSYSAKNAILLDENLDSNTESISFEAQPIDHAYNSLLFASISDSLVTVYDFKQHRGTAAVSMAKKICAFNDLFFVATSNDIYVLRDLTEAYEHVSSGSVELATGHLPCQNLDTIAGLFEILWNSPKRPFALSLLRIKNFEDAIPDVLDLFEVFSLGPQTQKTGRFEGIPKDSSKEILRSLIDNLQIVRDQIIVTDKKRVLIDTALVQAVAYIGNVDELSKLLDDRILPLQSAMEEFFKKYQLVTYPVYLSALGRNREALESAKLLPQTDHSVIEESAQILSKAAADWNFVEENIVWLMKADPKLGCEVLSCEQIDIRRSLSYCETAFPEFYPLVLKKSLAHKDILNLHALVNKLAMIFCEKLVAGGKVEDFAFVCCEIKNPTIETIEKALSDDLIQILRSYRSDVEVQKLLPYVERLKTEKVKIEIYSAAGKIGMALELLWKGSSDKVKDCVKFCRDSDSQTAAFDDLISIMMRELPQSERIPKLMELLTDNLDTIDFASAIGRIDGSIQISEVADFLDSSYRKLSGMRRNTELSAALAKSKEFESLYDRSVVESKHVALTSQTICAGCGKALGFQYIQYTPSGQLYHYKCLPSNQAK